MELKVSDPFNDDAIDPFETSVKAVLDETETHVDQGKTVTKYKRYVTPVGGVRFTLITYGLILNGGMSVKLREKIAGHEEGHHHHFAYAVVLANREARSRNVSYGSSQAIELFEKLESVGESVSVRYHLAVARGRIWCSAGSATAEPSRTTLYHQGSLYEGKVKPGLHIHLSPDSSLEHYRPGATLYHFRVPNATIKRWEDAGQLARRTDWYADEVRPDWRIGAGVSHELNDHLVSAVRKSRL
jgi:hypothetical protein